MLFVRTDGKMQTERNICLLGYYPHRQWILVKRCARWFSFVCTHERARTPTTYFVFCISIIITYQYTDVQYFLSFIADSTCNFNRFSFLVSSVFRFQSVYVQFFSLLCSVSFLVSVRLSYSRLLKYNTYLLVCSCWVWCVFLSTRATRIIRSARFHNWNSLARSSKGTMLRIRYQQKRQT